MTAKQSDEDLLAYIDKLVDPPHWIWTGPKSPTTGYGVSRGTSAHRTVWTILVGPIPKGKVLRHKCDIRLCVNPNCLIPGTQTQNIADARAKHRLSGGRKSSQRGSLNPSAKYTEAQIDEVKRLLKEAKLSQRSIARITKVHFKTVWDISKGRRRQ